MRKLSAVLVVGLAGFSLANAGCIVIAKGNKPVIVEGKKRVIEVDGEWYVVDVEKGTVREIESEQLKDD